MSLIPRPKYPPIPLLALYRRYTGDHAAPEELIRAALLTQYDARLWVVSTFMKGYSPAQISGALGITNRGVRVKIEQAMRAVWKIVNNMPRYYKIGHCAPKRKKKEQCND